MFGCFWEGCNISSGNDVYNYIPKGSSLSLGLLQKAQQILIVDTNLVLMYDISSCWRKI